MSNQFWNFPFGVVEATADGRLRAADPRAEEHLQLARPAASGGLLGELAPLLPADIVDLALASPGKLLATVERPDGAVIDVYGCATVGDRHAALFTVDVTDRIRGGGRAQFYEAANCAPALMWMTNAAGAIEFTNEFLQNFSGRSAAELLGDMWLSLIHPDDLPRVIEARRQAWAEGHRPYAFDARFQDADGCWRHLSVSSRPRVDAGGNFNGYVGLAIDRTEERAAEEALERSERRYRHLLERIEQGFCIMEVVYRDGKADDLVFVEVNAAFERLTGMSGAEGKSARDVAVGVLDPDWVAVLGGVAETGEPVRREHASAPLGRLFDLEIVKVGAGESRRVAVLMRDITERRRTEAQVRELLREVNHRSKNMLSVIQAVAHQMAGETDARQFARALGERLRGLAASHDLLSQSEWAGVELDRLVRSQLAPLRSFVGTRIEIAGPPVRLSPSAAQTLGMALQELASAAGDAAAFADSASTIRIDWTEEREETGARLVLSWRESGRSGESPLACESFRRVLAVRMVEMGLEAQVTLDCAERAVMWRMEARSGFERVVAGASDMEKRMERGTREPRSTPVAVRGDDLDRQRHQQESDEKAPDGRSAIASAGS